MNRERAISGLLLISGLGLALLGQFYFTCRREYVWDGVFLWCGALLAFGLLLGRTRRLERGHFRRHGLSWMRQNRLRALALAGGTALALLAGWQARRHSQAADFTSLLLVWLVGVVWFVMAFVPSLPVRDLRSRLVNGARSHSVELVGLVALLIAALAVRALDLEHIPANLSGDEGTQAVAGLEIIGPPLGNPFSTGWYSVPTMSFLALGLSMRVFGESVAGLRALPALTGALTVLTTFLLARELWGRRVGWMAAVSLASSHYHLHFSRLGSNQIADGLLITVALLFLIRGLRSGRALPFALAGVVIGLGWYVYFGARLIGLVVVLYLAWRSVVEYRFLARYGRLLLVLLAAALIVVAPLLFHYAGYPDALASRTRQVSIFASGWLAQEQEITGRTAASLLLDQFWKAVSAFHYTLDSTFWYRPGIPLLDPVTGVLLILGVVWATANWRWPANGLILLWLGLALTLGWVVTENPPSSQRLVGVTPALAVLVGLGLNWLVELGRRLLGNQDQLWDQATVVILAGVAFVNLYFYFAVYTPTRVYGNPTAEVATELARALANEEDAYPVYLHGPPIMYWGFGTLSFLARGVEGHDVPSTGEGVALEMPDLSRGARFVFLPERRDELAWVKVQAPGGVETPVYSQADDRLLYIQYEVAPP